MYPRGPLEGEGHYRFCPAVLSGGDPLGGKGCVPTWPTCDSAPRTTAVGTPQAAGVM